MSNENKAAPVVTARYNLHQLETMDPSAISGCSKKHVESVIADLIATARAAAQPEQAKPTAIALTDAIPDVLFDGNAVYAEITRKLGKSHCIHHTAVSATLDAVVRLIRNSHITAPHGESDKTDKEQA